MPCPIFLRLSLDICRAPDHACDEMQTKVALTKTDFRQLLQETPARLDGEKPHHRRIFKKILSGYFHEGRCSWQALARWHAAHGETID